MNLSHEKSILIAIIDNEKKISFSIQNNILYILFPKNMLEILIPIESPLLQKNLPILLIVGRKIYLKSQIQHRLVFFY
jgi:hypothetical protein